MVSGGRSVRDCLRVQGPVLDIKNGSFVELFFVNGVQVNVDGTSEVIFGGGGNPVNYH